jgi:hypothetical protein
MIALLFRKVAIAGRGGLFLSFAIPFPHERFVKPEVA